MSLYPQDVAILKVLSKKGPLPSREIADLTRYPISSVRISLKRLQLADKTQITGTFSHGKGKAVNWWGIREPSTALKRKIYRNLTDPRTAIELADLIGHPEYSVRKVLYVMEHEGWVCRLPGTVPPRGNRGRPQVRWSVRD